MELIETIAFQFLDREDYAKRIAQADDRDSAHVQGCPTTPKYPLQFSVDEARIEKGSRAEDLDA